LAVRDLIWRQTDQANSSTAAAAPERNPYVLRGGSGERVSRKGAKHAKEKPTEKLDSYASSFELQEI
jgi:hypothetical protein